MQKAHDAAKNDFWHNRPDTSSPITETELNRIETNIDTIDDRVVTFDITKANQSDLLTCVSGISLNTTTGILTITLKNGTTSTLDTGLAKLAINFDYDDDPTSAHYQQIILEMKDGTYKYIDLSALITQYEFVNTSTIVWTIESDGKIKANVPDGSITANKLQPNYLADITTQANRATGAVTSTEANRLEAEGFAKGTQNGQPVGVDSPYYENNAKFFRDGARAITGNKVDTWNGRDGQVVPEYGDYEINQINPSSSGGQMPGDTIAVNQSGKFYIKPSRAEVYYCQVDDGQYDYNKPIAGTYEYKYTINITSYTEANEFLFAKLILIKFKKGNQNPFVSVVFHVNYVEETPAGNIISMDQEFEYIIIGNTISNFGTCPKYVNNENVLFYVNGNSLEPISNERNATELWINVGPQSVGTQVINIEHPAIVGTIDSQVFEVFSLSSTGKSASISSIVPSLGTHNGTLTITLSSPLTEQMNFFIKITNMIGS